MEQKKTVGVIGGMGPMATADFFRKMILRTDAAEDSEHIHIIIDNLPGIPNRTAALLGEGPSPLPKLVEAAVRLKNAGADFIVIPCNTSHFWFDEVCSQSGIAGVSMVEATAQELSRRGIQCAAVLATDGTVRSGIYERALEKRGIRQIVPSEEGQREIMRLIYDCVKAGKEPGDLSVLRRELEDLSRRGAQTFIAACTELPVIFDQYAPELPVTDATDILAVAAVQAAGYRVRD